MGLGTRKKRLSLDEDDLPLEDRVAMGLISQPEIKEGPYRGNGRQRAKVRREEEKQTKREKKQILKIDPLRRCEVSVWIEGIGDGLLRNRYHAEDKPPSGKGSDGKIPKGAPKPRLAPMEEAALCSDVISDHRDRFLEHRFGIKFQNEDDILYGFPSSGIKKGLIEVMGRATTIDLSMKNAAYLWTINEPLVPILDPKWRKPADWDLISMPVHNQFTNGWIIGHRALFKSWGMVFTLDFNADLVSLDVMVTLIRHLGFIGIGSYNTAHNGSYGRFRLIRVSKPRFYSC